MSEDCKLFCTAPWDHLHITSTGKLGVCCLAKMADGGASAETVDEARNSDDMKKLRLQLLAGEKPDLCEQCIISRTPRSYNTHHLKIAEGRIEEIIASTEVDGTTHYPQHTMDIRGNTCNLKCRMCGASSSSAIVAEEKKLYNIEPKPFGSFHRRSDFITDELLQTASDIYWAGGEPFLLPIHWQTMKRLAELGKTDTLIRYNSNFTFPADGMVERAIEALRPFKDVRMSISCDALGEIGEYIRVGWDESTMIKNIMLFKQELPWIDLAFDITITSLGLLTLVDMYDLTCKLGIGFKAKLVNTVASTHYLSIDVVAPWLIDEVCDMLRSRPESPVRASENERMQIADIIQSLYKKSTFNPFEYQYIDKMEKARGMEGFFKNTMEGLLNE